MQLCCDTNDAAPAAARAFEIAGFASSVLSPSGTRTSSRFSLSNAFDCLTRDTLTVDTWCGAAHQSYLTSVWRPQRKIRMSTGSYKTKNEKKIRRPTPRNLIQI
jgi:hypothetical protein